MRILLLFLFVPLLVACVPQAKLFGRGCNAALVSPDEIVTAAHCLSRYGDGTVMIRDATMRVINATPFEIDVDRDFARLSLNHSVHWPYYATYKEPHVGATGFVIGGCPYRNGTMFHVISLEKKEWDGGTPRWEWAVRDGQIACPGDSGSPVWSDTEFGIYHGIVSRYEPLRITIDDTVSLMKIGTIVYTGAER